MQTNQTIKRDASAPVNISGSALNKLSDDPAFDEDTSAKAQLDLTEKLKISQMISQAIKIKELIYRTILNIKNSMKHGTSDYPRCMSLEVSLVCNRKCSYCPVSIDPKPKQQFVSEKVIRAFIDGLRSIDYDGQVDFIFYNEPLLHPHLENIVKQVSESCPTVSCVLYTNGDRLTFRRAEALIAAGIKRFIVSRHAPFTEEWDLRLNTLKNLIPKHIKLVKHRPWYNRGGLIKNLPGANALSGATSCTLPDNVHIDINGNVLLCCNDYYRTVINGNVLISSFESIWFSNRFAKLRKDLRNGHFDLPVCKECVA
jgi:cyclic pyranopterin phosphate synthase